MFLRGHGESCADLSMRIANTARPFGLFKRLRASGCAGTFNGERSSNISLRRCDDTF